MTHIFSTIAVSIDQNKTMNVSEKVWRAGGNTGNIVWFESVRRSIQYESIGVYPDSDAEITNIVIPMANQIHAADHSLALWIKCLEAYNYKKCRVTMIGLGAQLTAELNTPKKLVAQLSYEQKNALKELSSRTESIGIRGSITAECLELMGIKNYRIIGCPSFYLNDIEDTGDDKKASADKLCVSWGSVDYAKEQHIREFFRRNAGEGDILLLQAMDDFPRTLYEGAGLEERHIKRCYPDMNTDPLEIESYIKTRGHMFFDWDTWQDFLKKEQFTLSVGCRFHGNMMSYLAGIPALWIVHDSRTRELCEAMALPCLELEQAVRMKERAQFAECCVYGERFYRNKEKMYQTYRAFLKENGIEYVQRQ